MLILKQNAANSVPTPPAGKGTIFLDDSDVLSVKTSDGNVENFPTVAASNSQVVFMNGTSLSGENAFTYNYNTDVLNLTGTISVGNVKTDNLLYANGAAWDLQQPGGSNTEIQFNDADSFGGSAAFTFNKTSNLVTMSGNLNAGNVSTAQVLASANVTAPQLISNVVTGTAPFVVSSTTKVTNLNADMVDGYNTSTSATANTVVVRDADGSFSANIITATLTGAATTAGTVTTAAQPNITSVGTLSSLGVSGNVTAANITANTGVFTGNGVGLTNLAGANVTGQVANALVAGTVYTAAQPNITSLGTLTGLGVNGDITAANITANTGVFTGNGSGLSAIAGANVTGTVSSATTAGTVTTAAQPNITSVGTLTSLNVSGNSDAGNFNTAGKVVASTFESNVATGTAPLVVASTTKVANLNADLLDGFSTATAATANTVVIRDADGSFSANVVTATLSGAATTAGTVTTAAQPNITSVGTLSALNVSGNITAANITANTGVFTGNGSGLSALAGANVTGQVANALVAGTVYTNAQPNITSVGTLTSVAVTGNATAGNVYANSGTIGASLLTGTLTTAAQPNITSVGTLSSLSVTGNVAAGNLTTTGVLSVTGTGVSSIAGNLDMTSNNIINLATPVNANDAATKQYVDDVAQGLHTHDSCNAATSTTLAVASGGTVTYNNGSSGVGATLTTTGSYTTIDGVTLSDGMRILVKNEANAAHNGIYDRTSSTVLTRSSDFDTPTEMAGGDFTFVTAGTLYDNTGWVMTDPVTTVGTTNVNWVQFSGAGTYTAGTGLTLTGSQFSVNASQTQVTALGTVTTGIWNNNIGSSATFAAGLSGANLASITGGNVTGQVGNALVAGTVYTAAQPNITSVGTLTSLAVTGNASAGNLNTAGAVVASTLTSNVATGTAPLTVTSTTRVANLNVATAGVSDTITVTTQSSGNAFLVLGNAVTGTITESANAAFVANTSNGALYATTFVGAVSGDISAGTNANASNISSGTLPAARLSGTYTITVSGAATTAGTVTTAAQPNITSTGTLTSLTVSGNITAQSSVTVTNNVIHSVATGISAAGSNQGTATALTKDINVVSTVSASQGVVLPTAVAGMRIVIMNTSSTTLNVYPATGAAINAGAANAAYSLPAGGRIDFIATTTSQWYTLSATYA